ncbi:hypothetical protein LUZ60_015513 [Juncus effusus]|nr:hypothetical protein LUZ60_015513 [Juncus effusus]
MDAVESESDRKTEVGWEVVSAADVAGADSPKVVEFEDLAQDIGRLSSLSLSLKEARGKKEDLSRRLDSVVKVRTRSLQYFNQLEEMKQKLEARKAFIRDLSVQNKKSTEDVESQREQLSLRIRTLLTAGKTLSSAHNQLQEASKLLCGENGHGRLGNTKRKLRIRQQYMVAQVASLYPVKILNEHIPLKKLDSSAAKSRGDNNNVIITPSRNIPRGSPNSSLTILGLQLMALPVKKTGFTIDKKEIQNSATALGYVAHAVQLIASYLDIPLRYPLRVRGSHSYIHDYSPSIESISGKDSGTGTVPTEFPLFFEGQDTTRATYSIFLLNKDLEQLLNYIGAESLGPRHVLANLKELTRVILSDEFLDS